MLSHHLYQLVTWWAAESRCQIRPLNVSKVEQGSRESPVGWSRIHKSEAADSLHPGSALALASLLTSWMAPVSSPMKWGHDSSCVDGSNVHSLVYFCPPYQPRPGGGGAPAAVYNSSQHRASQSQSRPLHSQHLMATKTSQLPPPISRPSIFYPALPLTTATSFNTVQVFQPQFHSVRGT